MSRVRAVPRLWRGRRMLVVLVRCSWLRRCRSARSVSAPSRPRASGQAFALGNWEIHEDVEGAAGLRVAGYDKRCSAARTAASAR